MVLQKDLKHHFNFLSHAELSMCRDIYETMSHSSKDVFLLMPFYARDLAFMRHISAFIKSPRNFPIIIGTSATTAEDILHNLVEYFNLSKQKDPFEKLATLLKHHFSQKNKIILILPRMEMISNKQMDSLYDFCQTITGEKEKDFSSFIRFIYIGDETSKKRMDTLCQQDINPIYPKQITEKDCKNFIYMVTEDPYHAKQFAFSLRRLCAGSFVLQRKMKNYLKDILEDTENVQSKIAHYQNLILKSYSPDIQNNLLFDMEEIKPEISLERKALSWVKRSAILLYCLFLGYICYTYIL